MCVVHTDTAVTRNWWQDLRQREGRCSSPLGRPGGTATKGSDEPGGRSHQGGSLSDGKVERVQQKGHVVRACVLEQSKHEFKSQFRRLDVVGLAVGPLFPHSRSKDNKQYIVWESL